MLRLPFTIVSLEWIIFITPEEMDRLLWTIYFITYSLGSLPNFVYNFWSRAFERHLSYLHKCPSEGREAKIFPWLKITVVRYCLKNQDLKMGSIMQSLNFPWLWGSDWVNGVFSIAGGWEQINWPFQTGFRTGYRLEISVVGLCFSPVSLMFHSVAIRTWIPTCPPCFSYSV